MKCSKIVDVDCRCIVDILVTGNWSNDERSNIEKNAIKKTTKECEKSGELDRRGALNSGSDGITINALRTVY